MTDIDLPAIDSDKTIAVTLRYEDKLVDGREAYVQCALLYSTTTMERRIRVHTIALSDYICSRCAVSVGRSGCTERLGRS